MVGCAALTVVAGGGSNCELPSRRGMVEVMGARNSAGVLSEVLSTVIDLPWDLAGGCSWLTGVEKTRLGGGANVGPTLSVVATTGLDLSIEGRGGGGIIEA
jgi:hypothetical protein